MMSAGRTMGLGMTLGLTPGGAALRTFRGLILDGGDDATQTDGNTNSEFDFGTSNWSIGLWFKSAVASGFMGLIGKRDGADEGWQVFMRSDSATGIGLRQEDTSTASIDIVPDTDQTSLVYDMAWHHVLFSVDRESADEGHIYLGGVLVGTVDISGITLTTDNVGDLIVGDDFAGGQFDGTFTDIRIWKGTALTSPQAMAEATNASPYRYPSLVPTWQGIVTDAPGASQITPLIGLTVIPYGGGAAEPTPTPTTSNRLSPNGF